MSRLEELRKKYSTSPNAEKTPRLTELRKKYGRKSGEAGESFEPPAAAVPQADPQIIGGTGLGVGVNLPTQQQANSAMAQVAKQNHEEATQELEQTKEARRASWFDPSARNPESESFKTGDDWVDALKQAEDKQEKAAQDYYTYAGREAVGALRGDQRTASDFDQTVAAASGIQAIRDKYKYGGWDNAATTELARLIEQKTALTARLVSAGYDEKIVDRAVEYQVGLLRAQAQAEENAATQKWADENPGGATAVSVLAAPAQGLDYVSAALGNVGHNSTKDIEGYKPLTGADFGITGTVQALREGASADMGGVGKFLYNTGMSIADSTLLISTIGPAAGVVLGMGAASTTTKDALERGGTNAQALTAGFAAGVAEMVFEKFSIDGLIKMKDVKTVRTAVANALKQAGVEASEEVFTEISNIISDGVIMGQNSSYNKAVQEYVKSGKPRDEAEKLAMCDNIVQVVLAGVGGFLSGGATGGVYSGGQLAVAKARQYATETLTGQALKQSNQNFDLLDVALQLDQNSKAYQIATAISNALDQDKTGANISAAQWGRLRRQVAAEKGRAQSPALRAEIEQATHPDEAVAGIEELRAAEQETAQPAPQEQVSDPLAAIEEEAAKMAEQVELRAKGAGTQNPATEPGAGAQVRSSVTMETPAQTSAQRAVSEPSVAQKRTVDYINAVLPKGSAKVELDNLPASEDAFYDETTDTIKLNAAKYKSQRDLIHYLGHELVHNADTYGLGDEMTKALAEFGKKELGEARWDGMVKEKTDLYYEFYTAEKGLSRMAAAQATTAEKMANEVAADLMAEFFDTGAVMERFAKSDRTNLQKLRDGLVKFRDRLIGEVAGVGDLLVQGTDVRADVDKLIQTMDGLLRQGENRGTMKKNEEERYSVEGREEAGPGRDREPGPDSRADVHETQGGGRPELGRPETRDEFVNRCRSEGYTVFEGDTFAHGYRAVSRESAQQNARQILEEVNALGAGGAIFGGPLLWNANGVSGQTQHNEAVTVEGRLILINDGATIPAKNGAAHEVFHLWKSKSARQSYVDTLEENLIFSGEEFLCYQNAVADAYLGGPVDISDRRSMAKLKEEVHAYISGDIHEGVNDEYMRPMFRDYEAVRKAWGDLKSEMVGKRHSIGGATLADTNTPEFRAWFHDDSGELTNPDGTPKIFLRGSIHSGAAKFRQGRRTVSGGLFFSQELAAAKNYALHTGRDYEQQEPREFKHRVLDSWDEAVEFVREDLRDEFDLRLENGKWVYSVYQPDFGLDLAQRPIMTRAVDNTEGFIANAAGLSEFNDYYEADLQSWDEVEEWAKENFNEGFEMYKEEPDEIRIPGTTMTLKSSLPAKWFVIERAGKWVEAATYANTKKGLERFNRTYSDAIHSEHPRNPGWSQYYLSATKTLIVDAEGRDYRRVMRDEKGGWMYTDHVVQKAWADGYDCVVIKNVRDGNVSMEFDEYDNFGQQEDAMTDYIVKDSGQVKSVYNTGSFDRKNPDVRYSLGGPESAPDWDAQVNALLNGSFDELFWGDGQNRSAMYVLYEPPALLQELGLSDLPLVITQKHAQDSLRDRWTDSGEVVDEGFHGITETQFRRLPELIRHPVAVFRDDPKSNHPGGVNILTEEKDAKGSPIFVSINPDQPQFTWDKKSGPAHFVNVFGRQNAREFVSRAIENGDVLFVNKAKFDADPWLAPTTEPALSTADSIESEAIIAQKRPTVKPGERKFSVSGKPRTGGNTGNVNPETGFQRGSVADSFMRMWNVGAQDEALSMLESVITRLAQLEADASERRLADLRRAVLSPRVTENVAERNRERIERLIAKYGMMPQTSAAQQEVRLPEQIDDETYVAGAVQTVMAAGVTTELIRDELAQDILSGNAGVTYARIGDPATLEQVDKEYEKYGHDAMMKQWKNKFTGNEAIGKLDIARAEKLYVEMASSKDPDMGAVLELVAEIAAAGTQAGQAVQAMTLLKKMTPAGQLYYIQKAVDRLNKDPRQKSPISINVKLAEKLAKARTREEINAAIDELISDIAQQVPVSIPDKWNTWRYFAMLGNPRTHIRNLMGNAIFAPARLAKDAIGTLLEKALPQNQRTKALTASEALREFAEQDAVEMQDILRGGGKYNPSDMIRDKRKIFKRAEWLNKATQKNSELLEKEDWVFLGRAYQRALAGFLSARGVTDADTLLDTPEGRKTLNEARIYAVHEAQRATYRDMSKLAGTLNHLKRNSKGWELFLDGIVPFTKTPINIIKRGVEYSPLGLIKTLGDVANRGLALKQIEEGKTAKRDFKGAAEIIDELSANLTGTGVVLLGYVLAKMGLLTAGLGDDDEDKFKELYGEQAYSLNIPGVGSYTIDWMAPVALPLFVGAEIFGVKTEGYDGLGIDEIADGLTTILEPMLSLSMLDGLNDALSANKFGDSSDALWNIASAAIGSYLSQGIPTVFGQVARTIDPNRRTSFTEKGAGVTEATLQRFWQSSVQGKIPFYENEKMAYIDAWGRTDTTGSVLVRAFENFLSPGYINANRKTDVDAELERLAAALKDTGVMPDRAQKYFTVDKETYAMSQDEYQAHLIDHGQTSYALVNDFIHDPAYDKLTDEQRAKVINDIYDYAAQSAKYRTNSGYKRDDWVADLADYVAQGGDAVDYLTMKQEYGTRSIGDGVYARDDLSTTEATSLLLGSTSSEQRGPKKFNDPYAKGYEYVLTGEHQAKYTEMFDELFRAQFSDLFYSDEYRGATPEEREKLVSDLRSEISAEVKREMADWLYDQGIDSTEK